MATPSRTTRSRSRQTTPQPLPAVSVRQSLAFGSRGKADLGNQMAAEGITLAEGFTTARAATTTITPVREESEEEDYEEEEDDEELHTQPEMSRQGTYVGSNALYESPNLSQRHDSMPPPSPRRPASSTGITDDAPANPWTLSVFLFAVPLYIWRNLWAILFGAILLSTAAHVDLPVRAGDRRDQFFRGLKIAAGLPGYDQPPAYLEKLWMFVRYKAFMASELEELSPVKEPVLQSMINVRLRQLITELGVNHTVLEGNVTALENRISTIEEFLPPRMVVNVVDGNMIINDDFWHAITGKIQGSNDLFDTFVAANQESATRIAEAAGGVAVEEALKSKRVLNREDLMVLLSQNSRDLETRLATLVQSGTNDATNAARAIAAQVAKDVAENTPSDLRAQLGVLAKSMLLANTYDAISSVNWFSPKMGAIIDPHHTSPTALKPPRTARTGWWFSRSVKRVTPSPVTALIPWEETGDCWCAAKNKNKDMGKAQLAVITEQKIQPDRLIVEHIPPGGSENIKNAPQDYELWAELFTVEEAEAMKRKIRENVYSYESRCESSQTPPTESSILIACGRYDIHSTNWVQSVPMSLDYPEMHATGFEAGKFYYRVLTNWGADQTCSYRIRLTRHDSE